MASTTSQALTKREQSTALMLPPPPPTKRIKRPAKVLDEDTYTDALSHIIARDFFPGLAETEAQQDYLNSLESKNKSWIESAGRKLAGLMTPGPEGRMKRAKHNTSMMQTTGLVGFAGDTPAGWVGDTPGSVASTATAATSGKPRADTNMSLSAFQTKYTSEDNESFYKLLDKQNQKKRDKHEWLWQGNKIAAPRQIAYRKQQAQIEARRKAQEEEDGIDGGKKQTLAIEDVNADARRAMPDYWKFRPDNNFMFEPGSVEDEVETVQQKSEAQSRAAPKQVVYDNTRLPQQDLRAGSSSSSRRESTRPPSPTLSAIKDAVAGRPRLAASEAASQLGVDGDETPRVNGYAFVDSDDSDDDELEGDEEEEEQDWSKLSLGPGDALPNPFAIKEPSARDSLHYRMVDRVARDKRREKVVSQTKTPVPRFVSSPRLTRAGGGGEGKGGGGGGGSNGAGMMTPAAQRLLGKIGGGRTPGGSVWESGGGGGSATPRTRSGLREEWMSKIKTPRKGK